MCYKIAKLQQIYLVKEYLIKIKPKFIEESLFYSLEF